MAFVFTRASASSPTSGGAARGESVGWFGEGSVFLRAGAGQHKMDANEGVRPVP